MNLRKLTNNEGNLCIKYAVLQRGRQLLCVISQFLLCIYFIEGIFIICYDEKSGAEKAYNALSKEKTIQVDHARVRGGMDFIQLSFTKMILVQSTVCSATLLTDTGIPVSLLLHSK